MLKCSCGLRLRLRVASMINGKIPHDVNVDPDKRWCDECHEFAILLWSEYKDYIEENNACQ